MGRIKEAWLAGVDLALGAINAPTIDEWKDIWAIARGDWRSLISEDTRNVWDTRLRDSLAADGVSEDTLRIVDEFVASDFPANFLTSWGFWAIYQSGRLANLGRIVNAEGMYSIAKEYRPSRPPPFDAFAMVFEGDLAMGAAKDALRDQGWSDEYIDNYEKVARTWTDAGTALELYRRDEVSEFEFYERLGKLGFSSEAMIDLETLSERIPDIGDLISMGVREAWRDDVAAKYGYDEDFPAEMAEWAEKRGLSREWATRYWRAHWTLPGPTMARGMLWRRIMSKDEYKTLLRIADYPRAFRDWMTESAYSVWTRVDIRRMHALGVIKTREELESAYMDIGYRGKYLDGIVDFTIAYNQTDEREATKTEIVDAYEIGRLTSDETRAALIDIGIVDWVADTLIAKADYARDKKRATLIIRNTEKAYKANKLSRTDVVARLAALPLPAAEIDVRLEEWDLEIESTIAVPTKAELRIWYMDFEIDEVEYRDGLEARQIASDDIPHYVNDANRRIKEEADKEWEAALKEQENVRTREIKTLADIAIADYRVNIAKARSAIADIKLALAEEVTDEEIEAYKQQILELKAIIRYLQQDIAEVRQETIIELAKEE